MLVMSVARRLDRFAHIACQAARQAGALLAAHLGEPTTVHTKRSAIDLVTEFDKAAEKLIHRKLLRAFPDHGFCGEEHLALRREAPYRWIVDPLDGTTNFVHGVPMFGVSIALAHHQTMLVGVIYDPIRKELFTAMKGRGAFVNGRRIAVSKTPRIEQSLLSTGFASTFHEHSQRYLNWFGILESNSHAVRRIGSTVLSLSYVAAGRLDGFYEEGLQPWDMAAGLLIVQEAGGRISNLHGQSAVLEHGELVASNGRIHHQLLALLARPTPHRRRVGVRDVGRRRARGRR